MIWLQYIPRNMHTVCALLCFVVVIHWLIFPYPSGLLHWYCGNLMIAPVPAKEPWWIWINTSCEFIINDCITTTKQSTTKPCAYFLGYTVCVLYANCDAIYNGRMGHITLVASTGTAILLPYCSSEVTEIHLKIRYLYIASMGDRSSHKLHDRVPG